MKPYRPSEGSDQSTMPTLPSIAEVLHHDLRRLRCSSNSPSVTTPRTQPPNLANNTYSPVPAYDNSRFPQRLHDDLTASSHFRLCNSFLKPAESGHHQICSVKDEIPYVKPARSFSHRVPPTSRYNFLNSDPMSVAQANQSASHEVTGHRIRHHSPKSTSSRPPFDSVYSGVGTKARPNTIQGRYTSHQCYEDSLGQIKSLSRTLCDFAETQERISPARLPRQQDVSHMLRNLDMVKQLLQQFHAPLPSPETQSGPVILQRINDTSDHPTRPQHASEQATGPYPPGFPPTRCAICKRSNVRIPQLWKYRTETLCRACNFLRTRQETKRILRRGRPG